MDNSKSGPAQRTSSDRRSASSSSTRNEQHQQNQFKGKVFYFDNECRRDQRFDSKIFIKILYQIFVELVKQVQYVGASVELFHTKKITHYISISGRKPQAQPPGPSRRSGGTARPLSRKDLMLAAVKGNQTTSPPTSSIEENRGVRYYAFDSLLRLVAKQVRVEKSRRAMRRSNDANKSLDSPVKSPKVAKPKKPTTAYPQTSRRSLFIETKSPEKKTKKIYLRDNFTKITDVSERFRPVYKDQMTEQIVSLERVAYNKCPFVGFLTDEERKEKRDSMNLQKQKKYEQKEGTSTSAKTTSANATNAKSDASKTLGTMWKNGGTCEVCQYFRYEDPEEHFESQTHKKNVKNYEERFKIIDNKSFKLQSGLTKQQEQSLSKMERRIAIISHRSKKYAVRNESSTTLAELERMKSPILAEETPFTDKSSQKLRQKKPSDQNASGTNKLSDKADEKEVSPVLSPVIKEVEEENHENKKVQEVVPKMAVENYDYNEESSQKIKLEESQAIENEEEVEEKHVEIPVEDIGEREVADRQIHTDSQEREDEEEDSDTQTTSDSLTEDEDPMMMDATEALKALKDEEATDDSWEIPSRMSDVSAAQDKSTHSQKAILCKQKTIQLYNFEDSSDEEDGHVLLKKSARKKATDKSFNLDTTNEEDEDDKTTSVNLPREKPRIIHPKRKRGDDFTHPNDRVCPPSPDSRSPARKKPDVNNRFDGFNRHVLNKLI